MLNTKSVLAAALALAAVAAAAAATGTRDAFGDGDEGYAAQPDPCPAEYPARNKRSGRCCERPRSAVCQPGRRWTNVQVKRFGDYADAGGGDVPFGVVACASYMAEPRGAAWAAMNPNAFGLGNALPCGALLRVTNRATRASVDVVVVDRMGDSTSGLDLDDQAFYAIDTDGAGVRDGAMRVDVVMLAAGARSVS